LKNILVAFFGVFLCTQASSETIISCGESSGYSYFFEGGLVPKNSAGNWTEDGIKGGGISLVKAGEELDLLYKDASSRLVSTRADGGQVIMLGSHDGIINILVVYPNITSEFFTFDTKNKVFVSSTHKYGDLSIRKVSSMSGLCQ